MRSSTTVYVAINAPFHYPDGVVLPGQSVRLDEVTAEHGIANGTLAHPVVAVKPTADPTPKADHKSADPKES